MTTEEETPTGKETGIEPGSLPPADDPDSPSPEEAADAVAQQELDAMMDQYLQSMPTSIEIGQLLKVPIVAIHDDYVLVDVGEKAEGIVPRRELTQAEPDRTFAAGDVLAVVVKGHEAESGQVRLSYSDARRAGAIEIIKQSLADGSELEGRVDRAVKGGLIVDFGVTAFLPASQVDLRRVEDLESWVGKTVKCVVVEYSPEKRRTIVSRRRLLEVEQDRKRKEILGRIKPGDEIEVKIKRVVEFGAFADLGGIDGLIPRNEVSWQRSARPDALLDVGQTVTVRVVDIDEKSGKVTLSRRQAMEDPWEAAIQKYSPGSPIEGEVVSLTNYGAFVRLQEGLDGMIHISDMAWDSSGRRPSDFLAVGQTVSATILDIDSEKRRVSLGLKQMTSDPWELIPARYPVGSRIKGKVTGLTKYGAFVELEPGIEGMIHVSDFSWDRHVAQPREMVNKGDEVEAFILGVDTERRRISLGIKQMTESPIALYTANHKVGDAVEGEISNVTDFGVFVKLAEGIEGFIHVSQLDRGRVESPTALFKAGETIEAKISRMEEETGKVSLSRRQLLKQEEKKVLADYMKAPTGTGTIMGELLADIKLEDDLPKGS